jgi:hypothetical protein
MAVPPVVGRQGVVGDTTIADSGRAVFTASGQFGYPLAGIEDTGWWR